MGDYPARDPTADAALSGPFFSFLFSPLASSPNSSGTVHLTVACFFKSNHRDVLNSIDDDAMGTCLLLLGSW